MASGKEMDLRVKVSADLADIKQGLGLLRGELAKVKAESERAAPDARSWSAGIGEIRNQLAGLAGAYIGLQTVTAGVRSLFDAFDRMDRLDELSQITGVSTEALSKLEFAAKFSGIEIETLRKGISKLSADMTSNKSLLAQLGISLTDAAGKARTADAVLLDLADVFKQLPDGIEKNALAAKLFGERLGPNLIPVLNAGKQGLIDYGVEAEKLGAVITGPAAQAAGEFNDNLDKLKVAGMGIANVVARQLGPALSSYSGEAVTAAERSDLAASAGAALANSFKVVAAGAIIAKNVIEGLKDALTFYWESVYKVGENALKTYKSGAVNFAGFFGDLIKGKSLPEALVTMISKDAIDAAKNAKAAADGISSGFSKARDGVAESIDDIARIGKLFDDVQQSAEQGSKKPGEAAAASTEAAQKLLSTVRGILGDGDASAKSKTETKIERIAASTVLLQDLVKRAQEALDQQYQDGAISAADYYGKRADLQRQLIDLQVEQLNSELAITDKLGQRRAIEEKIAILQRDRQQVGVDAARAQRKAEEELNRARQKGYSDQLSSLSGGLSLREGSLSAQVNAGTIGYVEGERQLQQVRAQTLEQLRALRGEQAGYLAGLSSSSPEYAEAQKTLLGIDAEIANITASMNKMRQDSVDVGVRSLTSFFTTLRDGATSAQDAFRGLVSSFAEGIYDMLAEATAKQLVGAVAGLFGGGTEQQSVQHGAVALSGAAAATTVAGGAISAGAVQLAAAAAQVTAAASALAFAGSASAGGGLFGVAHSGGVAGSLQVFRRMDPMLIGAVPRYHTGGVAGMLNSNETLSILQRGEVIRTKQQEAALQARLDGSGGGGNVPIRNIIVFGEDELAGAMAGAAGEKVIVNHVRRNRGGING